MVLQQSAQNSASASITFSHSLLAVAHRGAKHAARSWTWASGPLALARKAVASRSSPAPLNRQRNGSERDEQYNENRLRGLGDPWEYPRENGSDPRKNGQVANHLPPCRTRMACGSGVTGLTPPPLVCSIERRTAAACRWYWRPMSMLRRHRRKAWPQRHPSPEAGMG